MPIFKRHIFDTNKNNKNEKLLSEAYPDHQSAEPSTPTKKNTFYSPKTLIKDSQEGAPITLGCVKTHQKESPKQSAPVLEKIANPKPEIAIALMEKNHQTALENEKQKQRTDMLAQLDQEKEILKKQAFKEGYEEGVASGKFKFKNLSEELRITINNAVKDRDQLIRDSEAPLLKLSIEIAKKIIQTEMENNPSVFQNILKEALAKVTDKDKVIIKVNPSDIKFVNEYQETFRKQLSDYKQLDIKSDTNISKGGCVIETNLGYIDSSISTKLSIIENALIKTYTDKNAH